MTAFTRMATFSASTKRNPAPVGGKRGAPAVNLSSVSHVGLLPLSKEILERYVLESPIEGFVTYVSGNPDIIEGDVFVVSGEEYLVKGAQAWPTDNSFLELILEIGFGE